MPGPDPYGVEIIDGWPDHPEVLAYRSNATILGGGNVKHRMQRAKRILKNLCRGGWSCTWCGDPVPQFRRADAVFCSEGCRKRAARQRREIRTAWLRSSDIDPSRKDASSWPEFIG